MVRLGIDIGGSKIALAARDGSHTLFEHRVRLDTHLAPDEVLAALAVYLERRCAAHGRPATIAIASAPNLDRDGRVERWPNRPAWEGAPVVATLAPFARERIVWCDDGTAATLADTWTLGAPNLVHFSLGTGVGGGICVDGRVLRDRELGHLIVHPHGAPCSCGRQGCLQAYASGRAFERLAERHPAEVAAARWLDGAADALAACSANLVELFHSTCITLSGGLVHRFPALPDAVARALGTTFLKRPLAMPEIRLSPHGGDAPLQGALALAAAPDAEQRAACRHWRAA